jgi:thiosulfate/3-mercaptopyruvate sulfurtransferase
MTEVLVTTDWLAEHLQDENLRIIDIRGRVLPATQPPPYYFAHRADYEKSHIPNAHFVDWMVDIVEPNTISYDILNPKDYAEFMSNIGIGDEHFVVAYDDADSMFAARLWWTMRYYGHENVRVLHGGWKKWIQEARPTSADIPQFPIANFTVKKNPALFASADEVASGVPFLVDARTPEEYRGEASRAFRFGHIPNAVNIPRKSLITAEGMLKDREELRKIFASLGITEQSEDVVMYCNGGVSASFGLFALTAAAIPNGRVYDGSWEDWGNDLERPIVKP